VTGFGEVFIATFPGAGDGTESTLTPCLGEAAPALTGVVAGEWFVSRTVTVSVKQLDRGGEQPDRDSTWSQLGDVCSRLTRSGSVSSPRRVGRRR
jgi:hypothetical protein